MQIVKSVARIYVTVLVNAQLQSRWVFAPSASPTDLATAIRTHIPAPIPYEIQQYVRWADLKASLNNISWEDYIATGQTKIASQCPFDLPTTPVSPVTSVASRLRVGRNVPQSAVDAVINRHLIMAQNDLDVLETAYDTIANLTA